MLTTYTLLRNLEITALETYGNAEHFEAVRPLATGKFAAIWSYEVGKTMQDVEVPPGPYLHQALLHLEENMFKIGQRDIRLPDIYKAADYFKGIHTLPIGTFVALWSYPGEPRVEIPVPNYLVTGADELLTLPPV